MSRLVGLDGVLRRLNREVRKIKGRSVKGMIEASIIIRRDMEARPPVIPVGDTGNLRASWYTTIGTMYPTKGGPFKGEDSAKMGSNHSKVKGKAAAKANSDPEPVLIMGFSANYAFAVHEMIGDVNWNRPGSGAKFFESAIKRNKTAVLAAIAANAKIK